MGLSMGKYSVWIRSFIGVCLSVCMTLAAAAPARPQTPQPPFPYAEKELAFESPFEADVRLAGTLVMPAGKGPFPAVLLLNGPGQQDRDATVLGHKPFAVIADYLARRGIASLRVDDRGVGRSQGALSELTTAVSAADAAAALSMLRGQAGIDPARVGAIGHSEGAVIAAMLAAEPSNRVAFVVLLAAPGVNHDQNIQYQIENFARAAGESDKVIRSKLRAQVRLDAVVTRNPRLSTEDLVEALLKTVMDMSPQTNPEQARRAVLAFTRPWMRYYLALDPVTVMEHVRCPVLALSGEKDMQVRAQDNLGPIERAFERSGNKDATVSILPGLNHLFQSANTGAINEYDKIEESFSPLALKMFGDWIEMRTRGK
jgi:pimeloyl-ACP methyl ester carboxylesterase